MPLAQIQEYARLRAQGSATAGRRQALLQAHAEALADELSRSQDHLDKIRDKIAWYARSEDWL